MIEHADRGAVAAEGGLVGLIEPYREALKWWQQDRREAHNCDEVEVRSYLENWQTYLKGLLGLGEDANTVVMKELSRIASNELPLQSSVLALYGLYWTLLQLLDGKPPEPQLLNALGRVNSPAHFARHFRDVVSVLRSLSSGFSPIDFRSKAEEVRTYLHVYSHNGFTAEKVALLRTLLCAQATRTTAVAAAPALTLTTARLPLKVGGRVTLRWQLWGMQDRGKRSYEIQIPDNSPLQFDSRVECPSPYLRFGLLEGDRFEERVVWSGAQPAAPVALDLIVSVNEQPTDKDEPLLLIDSQRTRLELFFPSECDGQLPTEIFSGLHHDVARQLIEDRDLDPIFVLGTEERSGLVDAMIHAIKQVANNSRHASLAIEFVCVQPTSMLPDKLKANSKYVIYSRTVGPIAEQIINGWLVVAQRSEASQLVFVEACTEGQIQNRAQILRASLGVKITVHDMDAKLASLDAREWERDCQYLVDKALQGVYIDDPARSLLVELLSGFREWNFRLRLLRSILREKLRRQLPYLERQDVLEVWRKSDDVREGVVMARDRLYTAISRDTGLDKDEISFFLSALWKATHLDGQLDNPTMVGGIQTLLSSEQQVDQHTWSLDIIERSLHILCKHGLCAEDGFLYRSGSLLRQELLRDADNTAR